MAVRTFSSLSSPFLQFLSRNLNVLILCLPIWFSQMLEKVLEGCKQNGKCFVSNSEQTCFLMEHTHKTTQVFSVMQEKMNFFKYSDYRKQWEFRTNSSTSCPCFTFFCVLEMQKIKERHFKKTYRKIVSENTAYVLITSSCL